MLIPPPQITSSGYHNLLPSVYVAIQIWPSVVFSGLSHSILTLLVGYSCHPIGFKYIIAYIISVHSTRNNIWKPRKIQLEHVLRKSPKYVTTNSLNTIITWRVKQIPWICWVLTQNKMKKTFPTYETVSQNRRTSTLTKFADWTEVFKLRRVNVKPVGRKQVWKG